MPILELLGSSETGGPQTACLPGAGMRVGSVGRSYPHFETVVHLHIFLEKMHIRYISHFSTQQVYGFL